MRLIKDLFPDKLMKMQEGANMIINVLLHVPYCRERMGEEPFRDKDNVLKTVVKVITYIGILIWEFARKAAYVLVVAYLPWRLLGRLCPLIVRQQELTVIYLYFILSTVCGTITNTTIFTLSSRDSFLLNTAEVKASRYYFGRIIYRMAEDLLFGMFALMLSGVSALHAFLLALLTALARPVGELFGLVLYTYFKNIHKKKAVYDGIVIAAAILIAYVCPYAFGKTAPWWVNVISTPALVVMALLCLVSLYVIWNYKRYGHIVRELVFSKREDFN